MWPPVATVDEPETPTIPPPTLVPCPTENETWPPLPPTDVPVMPCMAPEVPADDEPDLREKNPLTPVVPAPTVDKLIKPLDDTAPDPVWNTIAPPVDTVETPESKTTSPPTPEVPLPEKISKEPPTPLAAAPVLK